MSHDKDAYDGCYECSDVGFVTAECFEDTCCCADPDEAHGLIVCHVCRGGEQRRGSA
jgi:hypothetical protein